MVDLDLSSKGGGTQHKGDHQDEVHQPASMEEILALIKRLKEKQEKLKREQEQQGVQFGVFVDSNGKVKRGHGRNKWKKNMTSIGNVNLSTV